MSCIFKYKNEVKGFYVTVPSPENSNENIDIYITPNKDIDVSVKL